MSRVTPLVVAICVLAAACSGDGTAAGSDGGVVMVDAPTGVDLPWEQIPGYDESNGPCPPETGNDEIAPLSGAPIVALAPLIDLPDAAAVAFDPDGGAFVAERAGRVFHWEQSLRGPVLDLSADTLVDDDAGLLGLAVDPGGGHLYVYRIDAGGQSVLAAYRIEDGHLDGDSGSEILRAAQPTSQHDGGAVVFDGDGHLYMALGDGGGLGDPFRTSQDTSTPFGSILRFDPRPGEAPAAVAPDDNPFAGPGPGNDLIWAIGLRNPFRFSIDPPTGDLWIGDVGQQCAEEIDVLEGGGEGGENLGWNVYEGKRHFLGELAPGQTHHEPIFDYGHEGGRCAVIAGHVYRGVDIPELQGRFVFADHCTGEVMALDPADGTAEVLLTRPDLRAVEIAVDGAGELYVVDLSSGVWRIEPA